MGQDAAMEACAECGFVYDAYAVDRVAPALRELSGAYGEALSDGEVARVVRARPEPSVWSALEYACHVRDVLLAQRERALLALVEHNPSFHPIYRDQRVELAGYDREDPVAVPGQLAVAADLFARVFEARSAEDLARPCVYNYPEPSRRDVAWLARHTVHEAVHHLGDVRAVLAAVSNS
jgi:hypothetical protein